MKEKSIIEQIFYGIIIHNDKLSEEEAKLLNELIKRDNEIKKKLSVSKELSELYEKINEAKDDYNDGHENKLFTEGFKLGFRLCFEILEK